MKNSRSNKKQTLDEYLIFNALVDKIIAGEIRDEKSLNCFIDSFCDNGIEIKKFRKNFIGNLIDLLSEVETGLYKSDDCFPLVSMMLNYLERNYIKDIHLGDSSKKLGEIINKLLEYSQSFSQRQ
ncbi:MAG: hypothetical protein VXY22_03030 [Pseudomonadota bacterium]|nr:hypothetical protein [Pseudomonadota bacterium]